MSDNHEDITKKELQRKYVEYKQLQNLRLALYFDSNPPTSAQTVDFSDEVQHKRQEKSISLDLDDGKHRIMSSEVVSSPPNDNDTSSTVQQKKRKSHGMEYEERRGESDEVHHTGQENSDSSPADLGNGKDRTMSSDAVSSPSNNNVTSPIFRQRKRKLHDMEYEERHGETLQKRVNISTNEKTQPSTPEGPKKDPGKKISKLHPVSQVQQVAKNGTKRSKETRSRPKTKELSSAAKRRTIKRKNIRLENKTKKKHYPVPPVSNLEASYSDDESATNSEGHDAQETGKNSVETWAKPYQKAVEKCDRILSAESRLKSDLKLRFEEKIRTGQYDDLLPKSVIKNVLRKVNKKTTNSVKKFGVEKHLRHMLHQNALDKATQNPDSCEFWNASRRDTNFCPPEECPTELSASTTQYRSYQNISAKIVKEIKKKDELIEAAMEAHKLQELSCKLRESSAEKVNKSQNQELRVAVNNIHELISSL